MDWLEELVEKIKEYIKNARLNRSLICCLLFSSVVAVILYIFTRNICYGWITVLGQRYPKMQYYIDSGLVLTVNVAGNAVEFAMMLLLFLYRYSLILYMFIAMIIGARIFTRKKIDTAVESIHTSLEYLIQGDYNHELSYQSNDELGMICLEVDEFRQRLVEEKRRQWEGDEGQRSINSAFAHDIRTPLTVMMGYTEFLLKYVPQGKISEQMLSEKLETMYQQQIRLLEFSKTMTEVQHMELRELHCKKHYLWELMERLRETAEVMEKQSGISIYIEMENGKNKLESRNEAGNKEVSVDLSLILEVCENLLGNAVRYAKHEIHIAIKIGEKNLTIFVKDDGMGFSLKGQRKAAELYYSESKGEENHFGMGLYICKALCEKHGGNLSIINGVEGGAIVAATVRI